MMKKAFLFGCVFLLLTVFPCAASAYTDEQAKAAGADALYRELPDSARREIGNVTADDTADIDKTMGKFLDKAGVLIPGVMKNAVRSALSLFAIAVLCGICSAANEVSPASGGIRYVNIAGAAAITTASITNVRSMLGLCVSALSDVSVFSKALMPAVATSAAMAGMPLSGSAQCAATLLFADFFITLVNRVILPLVYAYIALITANAALSNGLMKKSADFVKWLCTSSLKLILTLFVAYLSISGAVSGSADAFAVKSLKFALGGALPVVGSIVADASESMVAGAGILKNSIGVYGMIAIFATCFTPLLTTGVHYLVYKACAALCAPVCSRELSDLMDSLGGSFGLVFGMLGGCLFLFCVSLIAAVAFLKPV